MSKGKLILSLASFTLTILSLSAFKSTRHTGINRVYGVNSLLNIFCTATTCFLTFNRIKPTVSTCRSAQLTNDVLTAFYTIDQDSNPCGHPLLGVHVTRSGL